MFGIALLVGFLAGSTVQAEPVNDPQTTSCAHGPRSFNCVKFQRNYDGDTFTVNIASVHPLIGNLITVRVVGIDAPEMDTDDSCERQAAYRAQQEVEKKLSAARRIDLRTIKRDKYFRVLADVIFDGQSLAQHLLDAKLAVAYDGGHKDKVDWCRR